MTLSLSFNQQRFLHAVIRAKSITDSDYTSLINSLASSDEPESSQRQQKFLRPIHDTLDQVGLAIKRTLNEHSSNNQGPSYVYALVNTVDDQSAKLATEYTPVQLNYLKQLIRLMFARHGNVQRKECFISSVEAINAGRSIPTVAAVSSSSSGSSNNSQEQDGERGPSQTSISSSNAVKFLEMFVADGWLLRSRSGKYLPSALLLLELDQYLSHLNECDDGVRVDRCLHCDKIVSVYQGAGVCSRSAECGAALHKYCYQLISRNNNNNSGSVKCTKCNQGLISQWKSDAVEEVAMDES